MEAPEPPQLPEDAGSPETEPAGSLEPPGIVPPTAVATGKAPRGRPPSTPTVYSRRLSSTGRIARVFLALVTILLGAATADIAGWTVLVLVAAMVFAIPMLYPALAAEGLEHAVYRRWRWIRRRYGRLLGRGALKP